MDLDEARGVARCPDGRRLAEMQEAAWMLLVHLDTLDTRARQVRGGLKPYARPVEVVDYLMGEQ